MDNPIFPQKWLDLRLEFTEEYLLKRERIKQMQEFKKREIQKLKELDNNKNDYYDVIEDYDLYNKKKNRICDKIKDCWH
tara:strand:+ start:387 stop:623 length:237 start_codon:yes stop_codon:yes gene_type:complete